MFDTIPDLDETAPAGETREERKRRLRRLRDKRYRARQRALEMGETEPECATVREPSQRREAEQAGDNDDAIDHADSSGAAPASINGWWIVGAFLALPLALVGIVSAMGRGAKAAAGVG